MATTRTPLLMHLDPDKAKLLKKLAKELRLPMSQLMRAAIDTLLMEHGMLPVPKRKP
jgi:hypothetical protein